MQSPESKPVESHDSFLQRLCTSYAVHLETYFPQPNGRVVMPPTPTRIVFYNGLSKVLEEVQERTYRELRARKSALEKLPFSIQSKRDVKLEEGTYYFNVGYFFGLYARKKAIGKNVEF